jgi:hypothetical protein
MVKGSRWGRLLFYSRNLVNTGLWDGVPGGWEPIECHSTSNGTCFMSNRKYNVVTENI